jgi:hypothetical protein
MQGVIIWQIYLRSCLARKSRINKDKPVYNNNGYGIRFFLESVSKPLKNKHGFNKELGDG